MDTIFLEYANGSSLKLTTYSSSSHYGIPVVRHEGCLCVNDYGPGDTVPDCLHNDESIDTFGYIENMAFYIKDNSIFIDLKNKHIRDGLNRWFSQLPSGPKIVEHQTGGENGGKFWEIV